VCVFVATLTQVLSTLTAFNLLPGLFWTETGNCALQQYWSIHYRSIVSHVGYYCNLLLRDPSSSPHPQAWQQHITWVIRIYRAE